MSKNQRNLVYAAKKPSPYLKSLMSQVVELSPNPHIYYQVFDTHEDEQTVKFFEAELVWLDSSFPFIPSWKRLTFDQMSKLTAITRHFKI